jgi:nitroreductase
MAVRDLVLKCRSYRRFDEKAEIGLDALRELVDLARHGASAANKQPLKYVLVADPEVRAEVFETLGWAAYLKDWKGPAPGERPTAYIVVLGDKSVAEDFYCDHGIACQNMLLGAVEKGLGGCILASINRKKLAGIIEIPANMDVLLMLALGKPAETVVVEDIKDGDVKYWRDAEGVHHVPKRPLSEIVIFEY